MCVLYSVSNYCFRYLLKSVLRFYFLCFYCTFFFFLHSYVLLQISVLKNWKETEVCKLNGMAANAEANLKMLKSLSRYGEFTPKISVLLIAKYKQLVNV